MAESSPPQHPKPRKGLHLLPSDNWVDSIEGRHWTPCKCLSGWYKERGSHQEKQPADRSCAAAGVHPPPTHTHTPFLPCLHPAMHKLLLSLALALLLSSEMRLESEARTPPYGVKLCGREFIRAVIFTCGGSRWRRAGSLGALLGGDSAEDFVATSSSNEWEIIRGPSKDLSDYYGVWRGQESHSPREETWALDRGARDVMAGLSNACCKWGCSKSEISSLC
ncbi:hypothetical protein JRQ81_003559 [Phrynocephalus forsythii]|uniref:Relaxin-3 n=1 Tax=Phrynocephalus forsythii TaxID=171643 RepID=A0A9Q0XNA0_9SAUR|nr:hypothetical protein JRQ81_003559 [Phrynocephalus forsythii]